MRVHINACTMVKKTLGDTNCSPVINVFALFIFIHSFRLFLSCLFKSTTTERHSRPSTDTVSEFHAEVPKATVSDGLPKVPTWRLERDSNLRPFGRKATGQ